MQLKQSRDVTKITTNCAYVFVKYSDNRLDSALVLVKHQAEFNLEGVVEVSRVQAYDFLGFVQAVDESVAVDVQFFCCVSQVEAAHQKSLDGFKELLVSQKRREYLMG
jgi:hypothetical protein